MDDLREYITSLFSGCRDPVRQVELITELTGQEMKTVIGVLRDAGKIPRKVTVKNYRTTLKSLPPAKISDEMRHYIVASNKWSRESAKELRLPEETIISIRREAYARVGGTWKGDNNGGGTLKEFEARCPRYAKDVAGDGKRTGTRNSRSRQRKAAG